MRNENGEICFLTESVLLFLILLTFYFILFRFNVPAKKDELAIRRAQITQKIHDTHFNIFPQNQQPKLEKSGQPDAR